MTNKNNTVQIVLNSFLYTDKVNYSRLSDWLQNKGLVKDGKSYLRTYTKKHRGNEPILAKDESGEFLILTPAGMDKLTTLFSSQKREVLTEESELFLMLEQSLNSSDLSNFIYHRSDIVTSDETNNDMSETKKNGYITEEKGSISLEKPRNTLSLGTRVHDTKNVYTPLELREIEQRVRGIL